MDCDLVFITCCSRCVVGECDIGAEGGWEWLNDLRFYLDCEVDREGGVERQFDEEGVAVDGVGELWAGLFESEVGFVGFPCLANSSHRTIIYY